MQPWGQEDLEKNLYKIFVHFKKIIILPVLKNLRFCVLLLKKFYKNKNIYILGQKAFNFCKPWKIFFTTGFCHNNLEIYFKIKT